MQELRKFVAPEFVFGPGAMDLVGRYALNFGANKVFLVTDAGVTAAGWADRAASILDAEGIPFLRFSEVTPNPRSDEVMRGAERYRDAGCDVIVAVGGGSPMDCAKGIGVVTSNDRHILAFEGVDNVDVPMPPLICIPTTAGTSADLSQFAIITDVADSRKIAIISKAVVPDVSLIDPQVTRTMDPYLTACTGLDALVHAIEAFGSTANSPVTDLHALEAVRLIHGNLLDAIARPEDMAARGRMMLGSLQAGLAFSNASLGAVHAMSHALGGLLDLPHGECNSILLGLVMAYNWPKAGDRYVRIGEVMGLPLAGLSDADRRDAVLAEIVRLKRDAGIRTTLGARGVTSADIGPLARKALQDACMVTNPRRPNQRDIEAIYESAL